MAVTEAQVMDALSRVNDPELHKSLTELGMIENLKIEGGEVSFDIKLTTTACPLRDKIKEDAAAAVRDVEGVSSVIPAISANTLRPKVPEKQAIPGIKNIIAVSSGKGGVGKSTTAVNLAVAMAKAGASVGILDADIYGPNVPLMLGLEGQQLGRANAEGKAVLPEKHGIRVMSISFLVKPDQAMIWRGPILHKSISQFFTDMAWGELDYLLIDLPPGTGDAQLSISQLAPITGGVIVTTPQDVSLSDCRRANSMFKQTKIPVLGVVENMSYFMNKHGEKEFIFGESGGERLATELNLPLLAQVPLYPKVRENADAGQPIVLAEPDCDASVALQEAANKVIATICEMGVDSLEQENGQPVPA